ncbi:hypothetical protein Hanom_Chr04g00367951 [Helianthus anomalus]
MENNERKSILSTTASGFGSSAFVSGITGGSTGASIFSGTGAGAGADVTSDSSFVGSSVAMIMR